MSLLGGAGVTVAGHKISYGLLAVLLGVPVAALAIYQLRQGGGLAAGAAPAGTNVPASTLTGDITTDPAYQNLSQQVSTLEAMIPHATVPVASGALSLPGTLYPQIAKQAAGFQGWLGANQTRPDIAGALAAGSWSSLQGEFLRETGQYPKNWK